MIVYKRLLIKKDFDNLNENGIMYIKTDNGNTTYYQIRPAYKGKITIEGEIIKIDKDIVIVK